MCCLRCHWSWLGLFQTRTSLALVWNTLAVVYRRAGLAAGDEKIAAVTHSHRLVQLLGRDRNLS